MAQAHHVFNRGVARRAVFESAEEFGLMMDLMAEQVGLGRLIVYAFVLMTNHFHMALGSPRGELAIAMREILRKYVLATNPRRGRDGPLFKSRFQSKPVDTWDYKLRLLAYIDRNPVAAGLCKRAIDYPSGSARYFHRRTEPSWLNPSWAKFGLQESTGSDEMPAGAYGMPVPRWVPEENDALIAARLQSTGIADPLAREFGDAPAREEFLREYFRSRAFAADGPCREMPIAAGPTVVRICQRLALEEGLGSPLVGGPADETWRDLVPGLLRRMAGLPSADSGALIGVSSSTVSRRVRRHQARLQGDPAYAAKVQQVGQEILWGAEKGELAC